ncbi:MAG: CRISPR system precrRNA processing endoribonuclease RAMP protein Cas6 [Anaerolineae bacterium]
MPELLSLVIQLTANAEAALAAEPGRAAQALLLDWVRERDAAQAATLHESSAARPYTASDLYREESHRRVRVVQAGERYWLRFTALSAPLSQLLLEMAADLPGKAIELGGAVFNVQSVTSAATAHPWAGHSSYSELAQAHFLSAANPPRRLTLTFASPTAFHRTAPSSPTQRGEEAKQVTVPLPLPELVFGSLLMRWNAFAPLILPDEVRRYAQECLAVSRYRLQTHMVRFGEAMSVGFTGQCQYTALVWDPYWLRALQLLASHAFYSGVGLHTTVGMGQAKSTQWPVNNDD